MQTTRMVRDVLVGLVVFLIGLALIHLTTSIFWIILILLVVLLFFPALFILELLLHLVISAADIKILKAIFTGIKKNQSTLIAALIGCVLAIAWGFAWHKALSPAAQTSKRMPAIIDAVRHEIDNGRPIPTNNIESFLDIHGADPHNLKEFTDPTTGKLVDAWGRPLEYGPGKESFSLYSFGANQIDDRGGMDDIGVVTNEVQDEALDRLIEGAGKLLDRFKSGTP